MGDENPNSEKNQQGCPFDDLIFQEILRRLPIKSILRFKSVSKQWYSILSSSKFAINTLFIKSGKNYYLFSYNDDQICANFEDNLVKLDPSEFGFETDDLELTGSCNGLVCLTPTSGKYFILWNPATRKMHKYELADISVKRRLVDETNEAPHVFCGFWYASSVDDYKFVRLSKRFPGTNSIGHIFSLRENKWKRFNLEFGNDFMVSNPNAMLTNERLYWPAYCASGFYFIISFNLAVQRFDVIMLEDRECLGIMGGCLSKCDPDIENTADVLMHIFESTGVILKSSKFEYRLTLGRPSQMIGFNKTGKFFVTGTFNNEVNDLDSRMLGVIDTGIKPMQYTLLLSFDDKIDIARYVPSSLVSPVPFELPFEKLSMA